MSSFRQADIAAVFRRGRENCNGPLGWPCKRFGPNLGTDGSEYGMHPLLHKYAGLLLEQFNSEESARIQHGFYHFYTDFVVNHSKTTPEDLDTIDRMLSNVICAIGLSANFQDYVRVGDTVFALSVTMSFFTSRNLDGDSIPLLQMAIDASKRLGDSNAESALTGHLGTAFSRIGMIVEAISSYEQAIVLSRECGNDYDLASHLQNLGAVLLSQALNLPRAERVLHEALTIAQSARHADAVIGCLSTLARLHRSIGSIEESARLYEGALEASRFAKNRRSEGNNLSNLGLATLDLGNPEEAEKLIREALAIAVEIGDRRGEGNRTGHLGRILFERATCCKVGFERAQLMSAAREFTTVAPESANETGDTEKAACWSMNLGNIEIFDGNVAPGLAWYEEALRISESCGFLFLKPKLGSTWDWHWFLKGSYIQLWNILRSPVGCSMECSLHWLPKLMEYVFRVNQVIMQFK